MKKDSFQLRSMTAFGRGEISFDFGRMTVEVMSLNRRYLEINLSLPRHLSCHEIDLRKNVSSLIARGQVNVTINWFFEGKKPVELIPNLSLASELKKGWEQIAEHTGLELDLNILKSSGDTLFFEKPLEQKQTYHALKSALKIATAALVEMKQLEGEELGQDIDSQLKKIEKNLASVETLAPNATEKYRKKLNDRMEELSFDVDDRVLKEIAIYAERVDICEELVRAQSHLKQFYALMASPLEGLKASKGKKLDFLCQELLREVNTIGSKSSLIEVSQLVIEMKADLEKVREQVQNVE